MTLVTTISIRERMNYNFVNLFKAVSGFGKSTVPSKLNPAVDRLVKNKLVSIASLSVTKADAIFHVDRFNLTFTLSNENAEHFVLLRGLLEFSRPKTIKIISNSTDKTFRAAFSEKDADHFVTYLETILNRLIREIKFKKSLRALIAFESKVKREQAILYADLKLSA